VPPKLHIERESSQAEIVASERRLGSLLSLSYEPMLVWRLNGLVEFWNTGAERLYGFAPEEAIGHSSYALLQTKFPLEFNELIKQLQNERYWSDTSMPWACAFMIANRTLELTVLDNLPD
jgi:PAS domain-containing protein